MGFKTVATESSRLISFELFNPFPTCDKSAADNFET